MESRFYEDIEIGQQDTAGEYPVTREEIVEFARKWDPQPFHINEEKAKETQFGGIIASAAHTMAISFWLLNKAGRGIAAISGLGWDKVRLHDPVRPDDWLSLTMECIEKRESRSKSDRGILRHAVVVRNHKGSIVCTFETSSLVRRHPDKTV